MSAASWPLQVALFSALEAALAPVPVHDDVPPDSAFPYVVLGDDVATDWSTVAGDGEEIDATIHVWSRYAGRMECKELLAKVKDALHERRLDVAGQQLVSLRFAFETTFLEPDGQTRHGIIRFTARLERA